MQIHKPITLHLPGLFMDRLDTCLGERPPTWSYKMDYFHYLVHHLTLRSIQNKDKEYCSLNVQNLSKLTISSINQYINYLVDEELLLRDNYVVGKKAYHFKVNPVYEHGVRVVQLKPGSLLFRRLREKQTNERKNMNRLPDHLKQMWYLLLKVEVDYDGANKWIETQADNAKRHSYYTSLEMIRDHRSRYFSRNTTNRRLDTNLTNMKRELRSYLIGDFVSIDLANSQPFLLGRALDAMFSHFLGLYIPVKPSTVSSNPYTIPLCPDIFEKDLRKWFGIQALKDLAKIPQNSMYDYKEELLRFNDACVNGTLYDDLLIQYNKDGLSRDEVKKIVLTVMYSRNEVYRKYKRFIPYQLEKERFNKVYPFISQVLEVLKHKDHRKLAILLQQMESRIFIDTICPSLVDEGIVPLTVHDCIIVKAGDEDRALAICQNEFEKGFGVIPKFHVKQIKSNDYDKAGNNSGIQTCLPKAMEEGEQRKNQCVPQEMACCQSRKSA